MIFASFFFTCVCVPRCLYAILTAVTQEKILRSNTKLFTPGECNISCWTSWGTIRTIYGLLMDYRSFENVNHWGGSQRCCHPSCLSKKCSREIYLFTHHVHFHQTTISGLFWLHSLCWRTWLPGFVHISCAAVINATKDTKHYKLR